MAILPLITAPISVPTTTPTIVPSTAPTTAPIPITNIKHTIIYPNSTIIQKKFSGKYYEGEITGHQSLNNFYKIKYYNGDTEKFMPNEIKKFCKHIQQYSRGGPPRQFKSLVEHTTPNTTPLATSRRST